MMSKIAYNFPFTSTSSEFDFMHDGYRTWALKYAIFGPAPEYVPEWVTLIEFTGVVFVQWRYEETIDALYGGLIKLDRYIS